MQGGLHICTTLLNSCRRLMESPTTAVAKSKKQNAEAAGLSGDGPADVVEAEVVRLLIQVSDGIDHSVAEPSPSSYQTAAVDDTHMEVGFLVVAVVMMWPGDRGAAEPLPRQGQLTCDYGQPCVSMCSISCL